MLIVSAGKSMKEQKETQNLYSKDVETLKRFMDRKGKNILPTFADAARVAIEYANAHGVLL